MEGQGGTTYNALNSKFEPKEGEEKNLVKIPKMETTSDNTTSDSSYGKANKSENGNNAKMVSHSDNSNSKLSLETHKPKNGEEKGVSEEEVSEHNQYEVVDGKYYYTDSQSGQKYVYDGSSRNWVSINDQEVKTDEDGRTYYYADNLYLCRDAEGNVFYLNKNNEWVPWDSGSSSDSKTVGNGNTSKWYFYQGDDTFYRDKMSGVVYKLNKDNNDWEVFEGKVNAKRPRTNPDEEFDSDEDSAEEDTSSSAPPGARNDPSIEYDGATYTKRDPGDNMMYEWDVHRRAWFPKLDEDFMATYQLSYGFNPDGSKNENPLKFDDDHEDDIVDKEENKNQQKPNQAKKKPTWFEMDDTQNTKVYISNLPDSTTEEEFVELMSKCGMILKNPDTDKYKIKMYHDSQGNFKGDALCTYIKRESVELAIQILDDYLVGNQKIHVERAKFELKGEYNPKLKPPKKKKKELEKMQRKQEKLFDWRPEPLRGQRQKHERSVIIRNVFSPKEFENNMEKILTHKESIRNQCQNFGHVTKLEIFDLHPDGVMQITFQEVEAADMCVATLNNRLYLGRTLSVTTWDGREKFRVEETKEQREERLKKWDKFLEADKST